MRIMPLATAAAVLAALAAPAVAAAAEPPGYVVAGNAVTPFDTGTNAAGAAIGVGAAPSAVAITPDGKTAYVTNGGDDSVTPVDVATNAAGAAIADVGDDPQAIAITPDGRTAYVVNAGAGTVTPIDRGHQHRRHADPGRRAPRAASRSRPTARPPR